MFSTLSFGHCTHSTDGLIPLFLYVSLVLLIKKNVPQSCDQHLAVLHQAFLEVIWTVLFVKSVSSDYTLSTSLHLAHQLSEEKGEFQSSSGAIFCTKFSYCRWCKLRVSTITASCP
jgi:hypothetical protein